MNPTPKSDTQVDVFPLLLSINETARQLNVSRSTVYRIIGKGELRTVRLRGRHLVPASEPDRYVSQIIRDGHEGPPDGPGQPQAVRGPTRPDTAPQTIEGSEPS